MLTGKSEEKEKVVEVEHYSTGEIEDLLSLVQKVKKDCEKIGEFYIAAAIAGYTINHAFVEGAQKNIQVMERVLLREYGRRKFEQKGKEPKE